MPSDDPVLRKMTREECLFLMASVPVGRIIYTRQALPAVELVNFALDDGDIIIRTEHSGKLAAATGGAVVAFEVDWVDPLGQEGWSVTAIGPSHDVTDPEDTARLERVSLSPWAPGERQHFIRITAAILNGRLAPPARGGPHGGLRSDVRVGQLPPRSDRRARAGQLSGTRHSSLVPGRAASGSPGPSRSSPPSFSARLAMF